MDTSSRLTMKPLRRPHMPSRDDWDDYECSQRTIRWEALETAPLEKGYELTLHSPEVSVPPKVSAEPPEVSALPQGDQSQDTIGNDDKNDTPGTGSDFIAEDL